MDNSTLTVLTGSTAQTEGTPTTPVRDGGIRATGGLILAALVGLACQALDLSDSDTAQVMALVAPAYVFLLGCFDKFVAPKL